MLMPKENMKNTKIINFFGGPGIGKSTQAAGLFYLMKRAGLSVELTEEFPKVLSWEGNVSGLKDQLYITANQHRNISRLYGKVDYIIIDSPILNGLVYKHRYGNKNDYPERMYDDNFDKFVMSLFKGYDNINIMLGRNDQQYQRVGRMQDLVESVQVDNELKDIMDNNQITFKEYYVHNGTTQKIFEDLFGEVRD